MSDQFKEHHEKSKQPLLAWVALIAIVGFVFYVYNSAQPTSASVTLSDPAPLSQKQRDILYSWTYETIDDEMRGATTKVASLMSSNEAYLNYPYTDGTNLGMAIRDTPTDGLSVMVIASQGQLWCDYQDCYMSMKFDDGVVSKYPISGAAAGNSKVMFLEGDSSEIINKIKNSEKVMIEIGFYDNGNKQFKFNTGGLKWS